MRNEFKYVLNIGQYTVLRGRIGTAFDMDEHSKDGGYRVTSLYFDDMYNTAYNEKQAGVPDRRKLRLRYYGGDPCGSVIRLEEKNKCGDKIEKISAALDLKTAACLMRGDFELLRDSPEPLARRVFALSKTVLLRPVCVVDYYREAYVHRISETRITFDRRLGAGYSADDFLNPERRLIPAMPENNVILEIKYNERMPRLASDMINLNSLRMAASKYVMCRDAHYAYFPAGEPLLNITEDKNELHKCY